MWPQSGEHLPQLSWSGESSRESPHSSDQHWASCGGAEPSTLPSRSQLSMHWGATGGLTNQPILEVAESEETVQKSTSSHEHVINSQPVHKTKHQTPEKPTYATSSRIKYHILHSNCIKKIKALNVGKI